MDRRECETTVTAIASAVLAAFLASCTSPAVSREKDKIDRCEQSIQRKLAAPSTYKRVSITVGIPDEKRHRQTIFVNYDANNSFNAPIRGLELCDFPYGPEDAKVRPVTEFERKAVAETDAQYPDIGGRAEPDCCMPPPLIPATSPAPPAKPSVAKPIATSPAVPVVEDAGEEPLDDPEPRSLCWQDYCPCEPPQGGPDQFLCRRLKAGLPVDDEQMSLGAGMRDARKQLEDFEAEHGPM